MDEIRGGDPWRRLITKQIRNNRMIEEYGAIHVLRNAVGGGRVSDFTEKKALRRCTVQR